MTTSLLIQGKEAGWLVEEESGAALVRVVTGATISGASKLHYEKVSAVLAYLGKADTGTPDASALWQISKMVFTSGGNVDITHAGGDGNFDNVWDDRASLSYS